MRKYLYTFLLATIVLLNTTIVKASNEVYYTNREGIQMTQVEYNNLLGLGFTEKQIYRMDYETYNNLKDLEGTVVSETKKYIKTVTTMRNGVEYRTSTEISEEALQEELDLQKKQPVPYNPRVSGNYYDGVGYDVDYKVLIARISNTSDYTMMYKVDIDWITMPSTRSMDIMGIGMEPSKVQLASSIYFREDWRFTNNSTGHTTTCYPKEENTGASVLFSLPSGSLESLEGYAYYFVSKKSGVGTVYSLIASGDYAHATTSVTNDVYNYFSINHGTGLEIDSPYHNSYDDMGIAQAIFEGEW